MHENFQQPATGLARAHSSASSDHLSASADTSAASNVGKGATFDDAVSFSGLRKLQDSSRFDKARFSFRLYKR